MRWSSRTSYIGIDRKSYEEYGSIEQYLLVGTRESTLDSSKFSTLADDFP